MSDTKSASVLKESSQTSVALHLRSRDCATAPALLIYQTLACLRHGQTTFIMVTLRRFDKGKVFKNFEPGPKHEVVHWIAKCGIMVPVMAGRFCWLDLCRALALLPWFVHTISRKAHTDTHPLFWCWSPHTWLGHCSGNGRGLAWGEIQSNAEGNEKYEVCVESTWWIWRSNRSVSFLFPSLFKQSLMETICLLPLWQFFVYQRTFCQILGLATAEAVC